MDLMATVLQHMWDNVSGPHTLQTTS